MDKNKISALFENLWFSFHGCFFLRDSYIQTGLFVLFLNTKKKFLKIISFKKSQLIILETAGIVGKG